MAGMADEVSPHPHGHEHASGGDPAGCKRQRPENQKDSSATFHREWFQPMELKSEQQQ